MKKKDTSDMSLGIKKSELVEWSEFIMDVIHVIEFRAMVLCVLLVAR
ncbi:hypothetical protein F383_04379 [Gossypium arboreum]|uniref:Uncharacterized protein n=1 Tax=Gossypium arboreum TaxID=29729 RepID=A0A0B0P3K4_GOSAR|nr:hypothetical protein F383_04379 [Gossypium arboreum]